ncbi:MAG: patatin-like phospholipase family protein [Acidimicrobiales bacterium]
MTTAWVLRGGASFGAAQVGMARALMEAGHHPDALYGTSAGALNATWLAAEPTLTGLAALEALWTAVRRQDIFPVNPWATLEGLAGWRDHLVPPRSLAKWLRATCPLRRLEDGVLPLTVVTTDIESGEEVLLQSGPAVTALLASTAMPGVFPPVRVGSRWLMDGSIACDTPVGAAVQAGATRVWVLPCVPGGRVPRPRAALDVVLRSTSIILARHNALTVQSWCESCELYVLPAPTVAGVSPFSFAKSQDLVDTAYRLVTDWLPTARPRSSRRAAGGAEGGATERGSAEGDGAEGGGAGTGKRGPGPSWSGQAAGGLGGR